MLFQRQTPKVKFLNQEIAEPRLLLDFLGFEKHVVQIREKRGVQIWPGWYDHAAYYIADLPPEKVYGPGEEVKVPDFIKAADYEFEIACVVGKDALLTSEEEAIKFFKQNCFLTIMNDWSPRDIQMKDLQGLGPTHSKSVVGKSFGPKLVPAGDFKMDEHGVMDMGMRLVVNGEERNKTNYNTIYHTHPTTGAKAAWAFPRIMAWLGQQNIMVHEGYIIGSGTVGSGCIAEFSAIVDPATGKETKPAVYPWLKDGDVVTFEVDGIGTLENKVKVVSLQTASVK